MLDRLIPCQLDSMYTGWRTALWLLGIYVALKLVMSLNSIFNTEAVAVGADGFPLDSFGPEAARAVLMLFTLVALGQLALTLIALLALVRYRAMVPLLYLVLIAEAVARRLIVAGYAVPRSGEAASYVNYALLALLGLGFALSLMPRRKD